MYFLRIFDPWKNPLCTCPLKYSLNPYTGCSHGCLYCYATSYIRRRKSVPKKDFIKLLRKDLLKANRRIPISMSNSSDPYPPEELKFKLTRKALELMIPAGFKILIVTKSNIVTRDLDVIKGGNVSVSITITTLNDELARIVEPNAPPPSLRVKAIEELVKNEIPVSVRIDPIIPFLNDNPEKLREIVRKLASIGVKHIVTSTYKVRYDNFKRMITAFPHLKDKWRALYFKEGKFFKGSWYLEKELRKNLLKPVVDEAKKLGITYATCREGLTTKEFFSAPTCDGTHLIPVRIILNRRLR